MCYLQPMYRKGGALRLNVYDHDGRYRDNAALNPTDAKHR